MGWAKRAGTSAILLGFCLAMEFTFQYIIPDTAYRNLATLALINVLVALSLNVINGMAGQFSIGHAGFVGAGPTPPRSSRARSTSRSASAWRRSATPSS